jgi:PhoH-like ATPase
LTDSYTGVRVIEVQKQLIDNFYSRGEIEISNFDGRMRLSKHQNMFVVLKDEIPKEQGGVASALCRIVGDKLVKLSVSNKTIASSIRPRNKEQLFAFEALLSDDIQVVALTGKAGVGKTLLALSTALRQVEEGRYDKIILTRQMTQVGKNSIGFLPGDLDDKFLPFNQGYMCNFEYLYGDSMKSQATIEQLPIEFIPLQLVRGASWNKCIVILDEAQNTTHHEVLTFGTRIGEESKVILLGDLQQRDVQLSKEQTGIHRLVNSSLMKKSKFTASIELLKCERGCVSQLFANIFGE